MIGARWEEIEGRVWVIPKERMKTGREHRVPLCDRAIEIVKAMPRRGDLCIPRRSRHRQGYG